MLNHQSRIGISILILLLASVGPVAAQQTRSDPAVVQPTTQCGGQYECVEDRPLTPEEARASRSHPQNTHPQEVAATRPTVGKPSGNETREGTSAP